MDDFLNLFFIQRFLSLFVCVLIGDFYKFIFYSILLFVSLDVDQFALIRSEDWTSLS